MQLDVYYKPSSTNPTSKQPQTCALPGWDEDEINTTNPFMMHYGHGQHGTPTPTGRMTGSAQVAYIKFLLACAQRDTGSSTNTTKKNKNPVLTFTVQTGGSTKNHETDVWAQNWNDHNFKDFNGDPILASGQKSYHSRDCMNNDVQICILQQDAYNTKNNKYVGKYKGLKKNRINSFVDDSPIEWQFIIENEEKHGSLGLELTYQYVTCADTIRKVDISSVKHMREQMVRNFNLAAVAFPEKCGANVLCPYSKHASEKI